ncbi:tRNA (adenosine(37)-N6)-threonylcarbamoyltransferase complex dimerization subunit type 1 TsaB [Yoonia litorea]|uniref:tRNA threonylcarbamoyl adenosine modification protein YeaZ n=1 Tax=Yoonia litorea TaxID=1123755 RepID=A0A1I6L788_9RHOB|nr:tRNA (adenosine(37)-N6)-threonylcarbamoyltransferase complex dimerization subunit type 1 TsaB [Yoonia litorea]SFR99345.1 tRNA threonylcarbamoyl adenosine modification protein YeaZ [Yoonia litorea]
MTRAKPIILAFDTSAAHCAAALLSGDDIVTRVDEMKKGQAEHLMPMLEQMLKESGLAWSDLDAIAVGVGPGNFTGIRIAVSAARGLALGLNKPAIGVNGFETRAFGAEGPYRAEIPAPRGQSYFLDFDEDGPTGAPFQAEATGMADASADELIAALARIAAKRLDGPNSRPAPLYVRSADAAPPRDPAPVILP